jgi:AraC-binding-like domain
MVMFQTARHIERTAVEHEGRKSVLSSGDMTLLDPRRPYTGRFFEGSSLLVVKIPRLRLQARLGEPRKLAARVICAADAENRFAFQDCRPLASEIPCSPAGCCHDCPLVDIRSGARHSYRTL